MDQAKPYILLKLYFFVDNVGAAFIYLVVVDITLRTYLSEVLLQIPKMAF